MYFAGENFGNIEINVNAATKGYIENPDFGLRGRDNISCWDLMQLFNDVTK